MSKPDRCLLVWRHPESLPEPIVAYAPAVIEGTAIGRLYTETGW